jgi:hypothetical protein
MQKNGLRVLSLFFILLGVEGCVNSTSLQPIATPHTQHTLYYKDVKPILDKRCVVCHSCYNSPCQAKFSSFEGIDRGGTKIAVYDATRLEAIEPTRLFVDARNTQEWRQKGFFSLTTSYDANTSSNDSLMAHLLYDKHQHPEIVGDYAPEYDDLTCPKDKEEHKSYHEKKPHHGMPYGMPQLDEKEYMQVMQWLAQGAKGYDETTKNILKTPSLQAQKQIQKWEKFFNTQDPKHQMTARYLYEHLYLAHIYFPTASGEFFKLIRSSTPSPQEPNIIPTLRPFDDPKGKFYYRFVKIHSTLVHKTHMTFAFSQATRNRFEELFIQPKWDQTPHLMSYDAHLSANPFLLYQQIPPASRYQFLLDNARYIVMTFIRGPVCRGQMALNVIHDHFWVMFLDPRYDVGVQNPNFLIQESTNLSLPIETVDKKLIETFSDAYRKKAAAYYKEKVALMKHIYKNGYGYEALYKGNTQQDAPVLTVYRHFDSASVHKGVLGELPRTMWVIDYAQFERIYYTLVAGYDVFGNVAHQTNIRRYMDFLRVEGELNFLAFMPKGKRLKMFQSWYINDNTIQNLQKTPLQGFQNGITFQTQNPKQELIEDFVQKYLPSKVGIVFDTINYEYGKKDVTTLPKRYESIEDYFHAAKSISLAGSGFISYMTDTGANNIYLRVKMEDGSYIRKSLVINRWHDNVNSLFTEKFTLNPKKDTMDILDGSVGSYPNVFVDLDFKDLLDFFDLMKNCKGDARDRKRMKKYFVSRSDKDFWKIYDWFQNDFLKKEPLEGGLYDLNRYAKTPWEKEK